MKKLIFFIYTIVLSSLCFGQTINKISTFYNTYNDNSGIIGITDSGIYEYSWYYDEWLEFPTNGLTIVEGNAIVREVSSCENGSHNPSGIYVISDTTVHVYNYYAEYWYSLYNTGLEQINGIVQLSDLSVHYDAEYEDVDVYVKSGNHIYYYGWYTHQWYPLTNDGLTSKSSITKPDYNISVFPNPIVLGSRIDFTLPDNYKDFVKLAIFTEEGKLVKALHFNELEGGRHEFELNPDEFTTGIYFYELSGMNFSQVKKFIKVK